MEKNVNVIDEQGNQYEATYPKRAKGLVKNGRARFVDEHTICLACPPNENLEDNMDNIMQEMQKMQESMINKDSISKAVGSEHSECISQYQVFRRVAELQRTLDSMEKILFKVQTVSDKQQRVEKDDGEQLVTACVPEVALEKLKTIRELVLAREQTVKMMLEFYLEVYRTLDGKKNR